MPSVVGLTLSAARDVAQQAGVVLAQPDPEGPPLAALSWRRTCVVTSQDPAAGTQVTRWTGVAVTYGDLEDAAPAAVRPLQPVPRLPPARLDPGA